NGSVLQSAPAAVPKGNSRVKSQDWFVTAQNGEENQHFSMPHVQNLFVNSDYRYNWVVSLSQVVEMSYDNEVEQGVLLLDVKYSALEDMLSGIRLGKNGYIYLTNDAGQIVYHPNAQLLWSGQMDEKPFDIEGKKDGIYETKINGDKYDLLVKTTGYTGWRLVGVVPRNNAELSNFKSTMFLVFLFVLFFTVLLAINLFISNKITDPILKLEKAVKKLAEGDLDVPIPASGFFEIWHLENSIRKMVSQLRHLMDDIVRSQQSLRKNELDVLQSQINPHFLYNTLDIIVWMIENEQRDDAVQAVTALARFFRISLSKGKAIISVSDEIEHVNNYLLIQKMRYKNKFEYIIDCDEQAKSLTTVKLILQPIVENAIYHAIEFMDGDGEIKISAHIVDSTLVFCVEDNGTGMTKETARRLENGEIQPSKRGSGIGVCNVAQRIKLVYGDEYGLSVESEPDCGTKVFIRIPVDGGGANNEYE
ncbi:MAG: sensor histidine kinase, partial [Oscillospiraceae bacterium]